MVPFFISAITSLLFASFVSAEQHIIRFDNRCGKGTPQLVQGGKVLSSGKDYVSNGPFSSGIAYLQTGNCLLNGENCLLIEMTLDNPTVPGGGSSTDISLIAPHAFNVETSFSYFGGCDGQGATCSNGRCNTAFFQPNDNQVQVQCQNDNANLLITFCPSKGSEPAAQTGGSNPDPPSPPSATSSASTHTSTSASQSSVVSHPPSSVPTVVSHTATSSTTPTTVSAPQPTDTASPSTSGSGVTNVASTPSSTTLACRAAGGRRRRRFTSS